MGVCDCMCVVCVCLSVCLYVCLSVCRHLRGGGGRCANLQNGTSHCLVRQLPPCIFLTRSRRGKGMGVRGEVTKTQKPIVI